MAISEREYGDRHNFDNPANAFRHALWVILIIRKCLKWNKNLEKAEAWAKEFTDWHEKFAPNKPFPRAMDLHNNKVGIHYFKMTQALSEAELIAFLKQKAEEAIKINASQETEKWDNKLVFVARSN